MLLTNCNDSDAQAVCDRLRIALDLAGIQASFGVATRNPSLSLRDAMEAADAAMYIEKRGRKLDAIG